MNVSLTPAYGRDYKSKAEILTDLSANKDFVFRDITSRWDGKYINLSQLREMGATEVTVRYAKLAKQTVLKLPKPAGS